MGWDPKPRTKADLAREGAKVGRFMSALSETWALMPAAKTRQLEAQAAARRNAHRSHYG